jgi:hypothetical protein
MNKGAIIQIMANHVGIGGFDIVTTQQHDNSPKKVKATKD